jgi:hypothetical protein
MRDHIEGSHMQPGDPTERRGFDFAEKVFLLGVLGLLVVPSIRRWSGRRRATINAAAERDASVERTIDKSLKDTFPASDPPASQYFDIPANRQ